MSDETPIATPSQTVGPFFHVALTPRPMTPAAEGAGGGEPIGLLFRVTDGDGQPVPDALVEVWQARGSSSAFARLSTDGAGTCLLETTRPAAANAGAHGTQASHINVCLLARGLLRHIYTRVYFAGDSALAHDPVLALVPDDRRDTLLAHPDPGRPGRWLFDLRLQGENETVFFNL
jgi:protocatechuate 3,4-dioxygenase alpha subunit